MATNHISLSRRAAIIGVVCAGTVALAIEGKGRVAPHDPLIDLERRRLNGEFYSASMKIIATPAVTVAGIAVKVRLQLEAAKHDGMPEDVALAESVLADLDRLVEGGAA